MTEPIGCFIDLEPDMPQSNLAAEARYGLVSYRKRPPDTTCHHPSVDFGKPERVGNATRVSVVCLGCAHSWESVKVHEPRQQGERDHGCA